MGQDRPLAKDQRRIRGEHQVRQVRLRFQERYFGTRFEDQLPQVLPLALRER